MWHCRQAVICLINIFKRGTMMALIIISPLLKHLEAFSSLSLSLTAVPVRPSQTQLVPCHCGSMRAEKHRAVLRNAGQDLDDLLGFFCIFVPLCVCLYFYRIFVFIVEESEIGLGSRLMDSKFIPMITRQRFIHCVIFIAF